MNFLEEITAGLVGVLAAKSIGVWKPDGIYQPGEVGIVMGALPQDPPALIGVTPYMHQPQVEPGVDLVAVQFRARSGSRDPRPAFAFADAFHDQFHGVEGLRLGDYHSPLMWRNQLGDLGLDGNDRYEITDNYYLYVDRH